MTSKFIFLNGIEIEITNLNKKNKLTLISKILNDDIENIKNYLNGLEHSIFRKNTIEYFNTFKANQEDSFLVINNNKQITLKWSYAACFYLAAINNSIGVLDYLIQNKLFKEFLEREIKLPSEELLEAIITSHYKYILRNSLDLALEFASKESALFLIEQGVEPSYEKGEHYSYTYKLNLHNALAAINNSIVSLKYYLRQAYPLPNEMLHEIASYVTPLSKRAVVMIEPLRQEIFKDRVKSIMKVSSFIFGFSIILGLGAKFYPLETTALCGAVGFMYMCNDTRFEEYMTKTFIPFILGVGLFFASIIIQFEKGNNPENISILSVLGSQAIVLSLYESINNNKKSIIDYIATLNEENSLIFADISYKICLSVKEAAIKSVSKFTARVSKSLENLAEGVSDLQSDKFSGMIR
ncbi:hypothetical protein NF27_EY00200 [Candidatus Jidaibacter acanthamoeba]|uniref:Uncharacterized protein n=1 Tax=Candidatus Jidaibacter acanthamoebae TaxID=86105 RepID=A0A0C1QH98_9RICK|nr:hypothetical protein [Candidatus Jidaibacter acanthamoeba]KIE04924.1 hypothetical protein NF27_EY00200 [Candidatus Jidaibacter acanthamoeba]